MLLLELVWGQVGEAAVRTDGVVVATPSLDHDLGLGTRAEPLQAEALVAQLAVEAFVAAVLRRLAGIDQRRADAAAVDPLANCAADELRAVVGAQNAGAPCTLTRRLRISMTRLIRIEPATREQR